MIPGFMFGATGKRTRLSKRKRLCLEVGGSFPGRYQPPMIAFRTNENPVPQLPRSQPKPTSFTSSFLLLVASLLLLVRHLLLEAMHLFLVAFSNTFKHLLCCSHLPLHPFPHPSQSLQPRHSAFRIAVSAVAKRARRPSKASRSAAARTSSEAISLSRLPQHDRHADARILSKRFPFASRVVGLWKKDI